MQPKEGQRLSLEVKEVSEPEVRGRNRLFTITFINPTGGIYVAQELTDREQTKFTPGQVATFEVRHPSTKPGGFDWLTFIGNGGEKILSRDNLEVSKTAFSCAVNLGLKHKWSEEKIFERAFYYAFKIKSIAEIL